MTIAMMLLRWLWPVLLLGGAYLYADRGWCNKACQSAKADVVEVELDLAAANNKLDALDAERVRQMEAIARENAFEDIRDKDRAAKRKAAATKLAERARQDKSDLRFGVGSDQLFRDIAAAANGQPAPEVSNGASTVPAAADTEVYDAGEFKAWIAELSAAFVKVTDQKLSCIARYEAMEREANRGKNE